MGLNDDINNIYLKFNRPSSIVKLYKLVKAAGITATNKDVKSFLDSKVAIQQTKIVNKNKNDLGHLISFYQFSLMQMDIFVLKKYEKNNKGYGYILCLLDIFSRYTLCYPLKNKSSSDCTYALKQFFQDANIKKYNNYTICVIMADSDSAFKTDEFNKVLDDNNAVLENVKLNDHHALGCIDRFARTLKTVLTKEFIDSGKSEWVNKLPTIVKQYNDTPHSGINDITPNDALNNPSKYSEIFNINLDKSKNMGKKESDLNKVLSLAFIKKI